MRKEPASQQHPSSANLHKHVLHQVVHLFIARLFVASSVAIHLVAANGNLIHAKQIDQARGLASLALDLTGFAVALGNGSSEMTIHTQP